LAKRHKARPRPHIPAYFRDRSIYAFPDDEIEACVKALLRPSASTSIRSKLNLLIIRQGWNYLRGLSYLTFTSLSVTLYPYMEALYYQILWIYVPAIFFYSSKASYRIKTYLVGVFLLSMANKVSRPELLWHFITFFRALKEAETAPSALPFS
jgi:hypothetical protein